MRGNATTALLVALGLGACSELHAQVGDPPRRHLDPAVLAPATGDACVPLAGGAISAATRVGDDAIAIARTFDPITLAGYDGTDVTWGIELRRTSDLSLIWARRTASAVIGLAAARDASRVAVATYTSTLVLDAADGAVQFEHVGTVFALAFGPHGELALASPTDVQIVDSHGAAQRTIPISGSAPTVVHAMDLDGDCHELYEDTPARAQVLAFAGDGTLFAGTNDGAVRVLATDDHARWTRPQAHAWGYATSAVGLEPSEHGVRATYADAFALTLAARAMRGPATPQPDECSAAELAIARRRLGDSEIQPTTCAYVRSLDVDASHHRLHVGSVSTVRDTSGASLLVAPTLRTDAGVLVGNEAWLFGVDGLGERWTLGSGGGHFAGPVPLPGHAGVVIDVSDDGRWVAVGTHPVVAHGSEDLDGYALGVIDTRTERRLAAITASGARARFLDGPRIAIERHEGSARYVDVLRIPDGTRERRVRVATGHEYAGLVAVDARWLVIAEDAHLRVVSLADGSERAIDLAACAVEHGVLAHDRLVMRVYDRTTTTIGLYRVEAIDLSGAALRSIATVAGANARDVSIAADGGRATFLTVDGVVTALDLATGSTTAVADVPTGMTGALPTPGAWLTARHTSVTSEVFVGEHATGTTLLDWRRAHDHAGAAIVYELGGTAYVIGHDGRTRAVIEAVDEGLVVRTPSGAFSATPEARAALRVPSGDRLLACDGTREAQHTPGLLEALLE